MMDEIETIYMPRKIACLKEREFDSIKCFCDKVFSAVINNNN